MTTGLERLRNDNGAGWCGFWCSQPEWLVIFIEAKYYIQNRTLRKKSSKVKTGAVLIMSKECVILTWSRVVVFMQFSFDENREEFFFMPMWFIGAQTWTWLLPRNTFSRDYAMFAPDDTVVVGIKVYTTCHPRFSKHTFSCGEVTYCNYWLNG